MKINRLVLLALSFAIATAESPAQYKPKRVNKAIELLEQNQPVFYVGAIGGYEEGRRLARTWADYIEYQAEHSPFDIVKLHEFMRGLVDGGLQSGRLGLLGGDDSQQCGRSTSRRRPDQFGAAGGRRPGSSPHQAGNALVATAKADRTARLWRRPTLARRFSPTRPAPPPLPLW